MSRVDLFCTLMMMFMGCLSLDGVSCAFQISVIVKDFEQPDFSFTKEDGSPYNAKKCILCVKIKVEIYECKVTKGNSVKEVDNLSDKILTPEQTEWFFIYPDVEKCGNSKDGQGGLVIPNIEQTFSKDALNLKAKRINDSPGETDSGIHWTGSDQLRINHSSLFWDNPNKKMKIVIKGVGKSDGDRTSPPQSCGEAKSDHRKIQISVETASRLLRDRIMV